MKVAEPIGTSTVRQDSPNTEWRDALVVASHALAHLDADRLEEMVLSCAALLREDHKARFGTHCGPETCSGETRREMALFARLLDATKANLTVMRRLRDVSTTQLEYGQTRGPRDASVEGEDGNH